MKCLVTGATGFKGRRLGPELQQSGHTVSPLSLHGAALSDGTSCAAIDHTQPLPANLMAGIDAVLHPVGLFGGRGA